MGTQKRGGRKEKKRKGKEGGEEERTSPDQLRNVAVAGNFSKRNLLYGTIHSAEKGFGFVCSCHFFLIFTFGHLLWWVHLCVCE